MELSNYLQIILWRTALIDFFFFYSFFLSIDYLTGQKKSMMKWTRNVYLVENFQFDIFLSFSLFLSLAKIIGKQNSKSIIKNLIYHERHNCTSLILVIVLIYLFFFFSLWLLFFFFIVIIMLYFIISSGSEFSHEHRNNNKNAKIVYRRVNDQTIYSIITCNLMKN